ncbi:hypothetical protein QE152_g13212 [Popillia japonica]|uniref:Uncharacterized protein n=1 Tax=Popillia japonica TaxID=7064 RepID=A0AAW1LAP3_POPJA
MSSRRKPGARSYKLYSERHLQLCLNDIQNKVLTHREASEKYKIPRSSIILKLKAIRNGKIRAPGRKCIFSSEDEAQFVTHATEMCNFGFPITIFDLRCIVKTYLDKKGVDIMQFNHNFPGRTWAINFLSQRLCSNIKRVRAAQVDKEKVSEAFKQFLNDKRKEIVVQGKAGPKKRLNVKPGKSISSEEVRSLPLPSTSGTKCGNSGIKKKCRKMKSRKETVSSESESADEIYETVESDESTGPFIEEEEHIEEKENESSALNKNLLSAAYVCTATTTDELPVLERLPTFVRPQIQQVDKEKVSEAFKQFLNDKRKEIVVQGKAAPKKRLNVKPGKSISSEEVRSLPLPSTSGTKCGNSGIKKKCRKMKSRKETVSSESESADEIYETVESDESTGPFIEEEEHIEEKENESSALNKNLLCDSYVLHDHS